MLNMSKIPKNALTLRQFLLKQEVLGLYRKILRTIKEVPDKSSQRELREWAKADFKNNKDLKQEIEIKMMIQHGLRSLKELRTSLDLSK